MAKKFTNADKLSITCQLQEILRPCKVVDVGFDTKRMIVYVAVAWQSHEGNNYLPDGDVYAVAAPIHEADDWERASGYSFTVTSDEMPAESMGIYVMERYCHCPAKILKKLSAPHYRTGLQNYRSAKWRELCKK